MSSAALFKFGDDDGLMLAARSTSGHKIAEEKVGICETMGAADNLC